MSLFTTVADPFGLLGRLGSVLPEPETGPAPASIPTIVLWLSGAAVVGLVLWRILRKAKR